MWSAALPQKPRTASPLAEEPNPGKSVSLVANLGSDLLRLSLITQQSDNCQSKVDGGAQRPRGDNPAITNQAGIGIVGVPQAVLETGKNRCK